MNQKPIAFYPTKEKIVNILVSLIFDKKDKTILDTGFGEGAFLHSLVSYKNEFKQIFGIELFDEFYNKVSNQYKDITLYHDNYLFFTPENKYDYIIGNPPYIKASKLDNDTKNKVLELTKTNSGDLYYSFIIQSILNLKENGELIYILPSTFFTNRFAKYLREFMLENGSFEYIIDFSESNIFETANVETIIFKYKKSKNKHKNIKIFKALTRKYSDEFILDLESAIKKEEGNESFSFSLRTQFLHSEKTWHFNEQEEELTNLIPLSEIAYVGVGFASGKDDVFKLTEETISLFTEKEKTMFIRKFLKAFNLTEYLSSGNITKMLFLDKNISEEDLKEYPNVLNYLSSKEEELTDRYFPSKDSSYFSWLAIRNKNNLDNLFNENLIGVPCLTRKKDTWFSLSSEKEMYVGSDILYLYPKDKKDLYFLLGFLNSLYFSNIYKRIGLNKGERVLFTQGFLNNFKIPIFTEETKEVISKLTKKIIKNKQEEFPNEKEIIKSQNEINLIIEEYILKQK